MSTVLPSVETESAPLVSPHQALHLVDLATIALQANSLDELANFVLPSIAKMMHSSFAVLYVADSRLPMPCFATHGAEAQAAAELERLCTEHFEKVKGQGTLQPVIEVMSNLLLYPLETNGSCSGLLGLEVASGQALSPPEAWDKVASLLSQAVDRLVACAETDKQLVHLNAYMTVSTMLVQSELNLHDLLEGVLYCCMDAVSAEAASVLLLDDDMMNFRFYHVEGPSKPGLKDATLPADEGIAGYVLRTQEPVIISEAREDPRFYQKFDSDSGFRTRNMIAIPLVTGDEPIGVLEVLNKIDADSFTADEQMLLLSIAEEIAFAIRNAKVFEFVANSYCKQRQGQTSCRGCERPLGAWTPCVQYQKTVVSGLWRISDMPDFG